QIAAGAVPGHAHARTISAELGNVSDHVTRGGEGVLERAGKARLRRAPVVDGDHDGAGLDREQTRLPVMGFEIAGDPAAAVEEHYRRRSFIRAAIEARGKPAGRAFHFRIACAPDWRQREGRT